MELRGERSRVVKAPVCGTGDHGFEPRRSPQAFRAVFSTPRAPVAQLDRVLGFGPRGCGFESCRARHFLQILPSLRHARYTAARRPRILGATFCPAISSKRPPCVLMAPRAIGLAKSPPLSHTPSTVTAIQRWLCRHPRLNRGRLDRRTAKERHPSPSARSGATKTPVIPAKAPVIPPWAPVIPAKAGTQRPSQQESQFRQTTDTRLLPDPATPRTINESYISSNTPMFRDHCTRRSPQHQHLVLTRKYSCRPCDRPGFQPDFQPGFQPGSQPGSQRPGARFVRKCQEN